MDFAFGLTAAQVEDIRLSLLDGLQRRPRPRLSGAHVSWLDDEIGGGGITAKAFLGGLPANGDLELYVSSPGGDAYQGMELYSRLSQRPGTVSVHVDVLAASAATLVMMAASPGRLSVSKNATVMIHEAWSDMSGGAAELRKQAQVLDMFNTVLAGVYADRSGLPASHWLPKMRDETWFVGQECVDARLADKVANPGGWEDRHVEMGSARRDLAPRGTDAYGRPVSDAAKRAVFARYEMARDARRRAAGLPMAAGRQPRSQFARETYALAD